MQFSRSLLWTSLHLAFLVSTEANILWSKGEEQANQHGLGRFIQPWPLLKRFGGDTVCRDDIYISIVRANTNGPVYCASQLDNPRSTETVYFTPTITMTAITSTSTYVETRTARGIKTLTQTITDLHDGVVKRAPRPTEKAIYRRVDQVQKVKAAKAFINKVMDGTTNPANPYEKEMSSSLSSACGCVYPDAAFTDTVTETDSPETKTIGAYLVKRSTTTSTTIVRTVTTTTTAAGNQSPSLYATSSLSKNSNDSTGLSDGVVVPTGYTVMINSKGITASSISSTDSDASHVIKTNTPAIPGYFYPTHVGLSTSIQIDGTLVPAPYNTTRGSSTSLSYSLGPGNSLGSATIVSPPLNTTMSFDPPGYYGHPSVSSTVSSSSEETSDMSVPPSSVGTSIVPTTSCSNSSLITDPTASPTASYDGTLISIGNSSVTIMLTTSLHKTNTSTAVLSTTTCTTTDEPVRSSWDGVIITPTTSTQSAHILSSGYPNSYGNITLSMPTASSSFHRISSSDSSNSTTTSCTTIEIVSSTWDGWLTNTTTRMSSLVTAPPAYSTYTPPISMNSSSLQNTTMSYRNTTSTSGCSLTITLPAVTVTLPASTVTSILTMTVIGNSSTSSNTASDTVLATQISQSTSQQTSRTSTSTTTTDVSIATNTAAVTRRQAGEVATQAQIDASCRLVGNQLYNGEFELRTFQGDALGWNLETDNVDTYFVDVPDISQRTNGGTYLGRFVGSEAGASGVITQPLTLCPGTTYALSVFTRQARILGQCTAAFAINGTSLGLVSPGTSWTSQLNSAANFTAGSNLADANVEIEITVTCNGDPDSNGQLILDLDDLSLTSVL